jgi:hypothetical protein
MASSQYASVRSASKLRAQRLHTGMTFRDLAAAIGSPNSWSSLRRLEIPADRGGRHTLSVERAIRIAFAVGIPAHAIEDYFEFHGVDARAA